MKRAGELDPTSNHLSIIEAYIIDELKDREPNNGYNGIGAYLPCPNLEPPAEQQKNPEESRVIIIEL